MNADLGAFALLFGGEERFEDALYDCGRHTGADHENAVRLAGGIAQPRAAAFAEQDHKD